MKAHIFLAIALACCRVFPAVCAEAGAPIRIEPDVVYGHKDGLALTMDVYKPEESANGAAILFMVSGGWFSPWAPPEKTKPLFQPYLDQGYTLMAVRHGSSPRYAIPEIAADVRLATRYARQNAARYGIDPERIGAMGMSAGGHLALLLGTTGDDGAPGAKDELERVSSRVAAVVALVPPSDLRVMVWSAPETLPAYRNFPALDLPIEDAGKFSPLLHVSPDDAPALIVMGEKDDLVPAKHGEWIAKEYETHEVEHKLIVMPGADHSLGGAQNKAAAVREALAWFDKHLAPRPDSSAK